jgi:uncharacterized membrane protein
MIWKGNLPDLRIINVLNHSYSQSVNKLFSNQGTYQAFVPGMLITDPQTGPVHPKLIP